MKEHLLLVNFFVRVSRIAFILFWVLLPGKMFGAGMTGATITAAASICSGATKVMTLSASSCTGGSVTLTYQWEESDDNGATDAWANAVGGSNATTASYTSPALTSSIYYRCKIIITANSCTFGSPLATGTYYVNNTGASASAATSGVLITVTATPGVSTPSSATSITCSSFSANWASVSGATGYYLDVSTSNTFASFVINNQSVGNVTTYSVTGLSNNTTYYYRVRATNCSGTGSNSSSVTVATVTPSNSGCYCGASSGSSTYYIANVNFAGISNSTGASTYTFYSSPSGAVNAGCSYTLTVTESSFSDYIRVWIDYNQDGDFADAGETVYNGQSTGNPGVYSASIAIPAISATVLTGTTRMRIIQNTSAVAAGSYCTNPTTGEVEDYLIQVSGTAGIPTAPIALSAVGNTCNGFVATWGSVTDASSYILDVSTVNTFASFVAGFNGLNVGNVTGYNVSGLSASTTYYYRVRASNCSGTSGSNSNTITASTTAAGTCYCSASSSSSSYYITNVSFGGISNSSGASTYSYYTSSVSTVSIGCGQSLSLTESSFSDYYRVWIDFNQDGTFSSSESILNGQFGSPPPASVSSLVTIPGSASIGTTRMRVILSSSSIAATAACTNPSFGEVEDYLVTIVSSMASANTWTGSANTSWSNAANWDLGYIPSACQDVIIPSLSNLPTISSNDNAMCRNITIDAGATLTVGTTSGSFTVNGNITNNGTINHTGTALINMTGSSATLGGSGNFSNNTKIKIVDGASVTQTSSIRLYSLTINYTDASNYGTYSLGSNTLTTFIFNQNGVVNLNSGTLEVEGQTLNSPFDINFTSARFNAGTGTLYYASGNNWAASEQVHRTLMTLYNMKFRVNNGFICHLNPEGALTVQDFDIVCPGATGGYVHMDSYSLTVNGNLTIGTNAILNVRENDIPYTSSDIILKGNWTNNGTFAQYDGLVTMNGTGNQTIGGTSSTTFYDLTINKASGDVSLGTNITVCQGVDPTNASNLYNGQLSMNSMVNLNGYTLTIRNTAASGITGYGTTAYINTGSTGILRRYTSNASYDFPVGNSNAYQLMNLNFTASAPTYIDVNFDNPSNAAGTGLPLTESTYNYQSILNNGGTNATTGNTYGGVWTATPNAGTPSYNISLYGRNYDNAGNTRHTVVKRTTAGPGAWTLPGTYSSSTTTAPITAVRTTLSGFSQFALATTTAPLPIELLEFTGKNINGTNTLSWKTASEINNSHFNIKRSKNAIDFQSIGIVSALTNNNTIKSYSFIDENSPKGLSYYQLEQTNINGTSERIGTIGIENFTSIENLSIFKNENSEVVTQFTASSNEKFEIDVYEVTGRKIYTYSGTALEGSNVLKLNNLKVNTGLYLISLRKSNSIINKKVSL